MFSTQLFKSEHLILNGYDLEKDAPIEAGFTHDLVYAWKFNPEIPAHPYSAFEVKKRREEQLKKAAEDDSSCVYFAIRTREERRFVGVLAFPWVFWSNREGGMTILIGSEEGRAQYFDEVMQMALRYTFEELHLYFLNTVSAEFEPETLAAYQNAGMKAVVRQKDMLYRHGRYWDRLMMGILQEEWLNKAERG